MSDQPWLVGVKTPDPLDYIARNDKREIQLIAIDPKVQKIAVPGLKLVRVEHKVLSVLVKQNNGLYRYESRAKDVTLDEQPPWPRPAARWRSTPARPAFALEVCTAQGLVLNRVQYTVAGAANLSRSMDRNAELQIKLNKKSYEPGESSTWPSRRPTPAPASITIERDKVYAHAWFKAEQTASVQHIALPGLRGQRLCERAVRARSVLRRDLHQPAVLRRRALCHRTGPRTAKIRLDAPALAKPGDTLKMTLHSDKPVRAFVFAVDEGILQVARYSTPDPLKHFFQKRALEVSTLQTLDLVLPEFRKLMQSAGPGGDGDGEAGEHLNPLPSASATSRWPTGPAWWTWNGEKSFSYTLPDTFNGAVRVMAVVVSDEAVASASTTSTVRGDVLLPTVPTSLAPGDTVDIGVGVANDVAGSGKRARPSAWPSPSATGWRWWATPPRPSRSAKRARPSLSSACAPSPAPRRCWARPACLHRHVRQGQRQARHRPERAPGLGPGDAGRSGTAVGTGELESQLDAYPAFARSELAVSATPWAFASGLIRYLDGYPYGCTEQLVSQTLPSVVLAAQPELAKEFNKSRAALGQTAFSPQQALQRTLTQAACPPDRPMAALPCGRAARPMTLPPTRCSCCWKRSASWPCRRTW